MTRIVTLAEAPELEEALGTLTSVWPRFMLEDPFGTIYYGNLEPWKDKVLIALDGDRVVGRAYRITFAMGEEIGRPGLPDRGWDGIIEWSYHDAILGRAPTHTSALEISILPERRGSGLAGRLIEAMAGAAASEGFDALHAPVRPTQKAEEPDTPMVEYIARTREDGLPFDAWIRAHVRLGADILGVCATAMTISGTLAEWRTWTGLPFDRSGPCHVPGALVPVHVSVDHDHAVYVEPNVWMRHPLRATS